MDLQNKCGTKSDLPMHKNDSVDSFEQDRLKDTVSAVLSLAAFHSFISIRSTKM